MAISRIKGKQLEPSTNPGSLFATDTSNNFVVVSPTTGTSHLWGYKNGTTSTLPILIGSNLSFDAGTNTLNASAGAGGYSEVQEEGSALTTRTKLNFIGSGFTAADDAANSRTNITLDATLNALAAFNSNGILVQTAADTFTSRVLTGTSARITITNGDGVAGNPTVDIDATYAGQTSITTLGTVGTGTWNATTIAVNKGGTGLTSYTTGMLLYASGTTTIAGLADVATGSVLKSGGVGVAPSWGTLASTDLTNSSNIALLNGNQTFTGTNTFSNNITMNGTPSASTDVVTVGYVANIIANGLKYHSVRGATTSALTITGRTATTLTVGGTTLTVDGVTYANGEYILVKDNSTGAGGGNFDNGAYSVSGVGSSILLTRAPYMDAATEIDGHTFIIEDGTTNAGTIWATISEVTTLGTDAIAFTQIQTSGTVTGTGVNNQIAVWSGTNSQDGNSTFTWDQTQMTIGTATPVTSARVTTQGTGTGNTTFGLVHNNSSSTNVFKVADDGTTTIGSTTPLKLTNTTITNTFADITIGAASSVTFQSGGSSVTGAQAIFDATRNITSGVSMNASFTGTFNPTSGTATNTQMYVANTINQTGGANGITRGLHVNPTITAAADYRAVEITANSTHYALYSTAGKIRFDFGSPAVGDILTRDTGGEETRIAAGTSGYVLTSNGAGTKPTYQAPAGGTIIRAYLTGSTSSVIDLDSGTGVTDIDGTNITFTVPTDLEKVFVVRNGVLLSRSGTVSRDYTLVSATGVLTLASALSSDESLMVYKIV